MPLNRVNYDLRKSVLHVDNKQTSISTTNAGLLTTSPLCYSVLAVKSLPGQSSYPVCLHRRSPLIKCVWGPAWSARTNPPFHSLMTTAASLQTRTTSCTLMGEERNREWCSFYSQMKAFCNSLTTLHRTLGHDRSHLGHRSFHPHQS